MVQPNQNILFASDLSVKMKTIFEQAATLAVRQNANMVVLHVMEQTPQSEKRIRMAFGETLYQDLKSEQKQGARNILIGKNIDALKIKQAISGFFENAGNGSETENEKPTDGNTLIQKILVAEGRSIADEITATAVDEDCSLIVLRCTQKGLLAKTMGDHVVRKVLKRSPVPVLVIPFKDEELG